MFLVVVHYREIVQIKVSHGQRCEGHGEVNMRSVRMSTASSPCGVDGAPLLASVSDDTPRAWPPRDGRSLGPSYPEWSPGPRH